MPLCMAVSDFDTKVAVAVRDDLEPWQRLRRARRS